MRTTGPVAVAAAVVLGLVTACGPAMPTSVAGGSEVTVGWAGGVTTTNAATAKAGSSDLELASLTRAQFGQIVGGTVEADRTFGTASIVRSAPFTVRYDLASPEWSDGIPIDASDLLLAWAAGSGGEHGFTPREDDLAHSDRLVRFDESHRAIEVSFATPEPEWATALQVAVPAHVVGRLAFGIGDPMEAKKKVADAIRDGDTAALAKIAAAWNTGFALTATDTPSRLLLSSGPYRISSVSGTGADQQVTLVPNRHYRGPQAPTYARIVLRGQPEADRLAALGHGDDVVALTPTRALSGPVTALERRDYHVTTAGDGTLWTVVLRGDGGLFDGPKASTAFLSSLPRGAMIDAGGAGWAKAYAASDSFLFAPGSKAYELAVQDNGYTARLGKAGSGTEAITAAGLQPGTRVCVGYDTGSEFARAAVAAMRTGMAEAGWTITDCGKAGLTRLSDNPRADAVLIRVPIPDDPTQVAALWGGDHALPGLSSNKRDALLAKLAVETDPYDARDLRIAIERTLVEEALAAPIATNPRLAVTLPTVDGVKLRPGAGALLGGAAEWSPQK
ncbi:ABC transporter substrate-binding protein [Nocardioides sp.]|uniref:ABC transporter substrate-binding protein n=1 Tax=Nocardioides sp. TaxID=35761 RepID=UPI002633F935|nr:ABC transporter substrate-binding protein [Nocardioides sp.]